MWKKYLGEITGIILGTALMALSYQLFLVPNKIAAGGVSGLAIIFFHLYEIPVGFTVLAGNIPLFILAWRYRGWRFVANSLGGTLLLPLMLELFTFVPPLTSDLLLASVFGGIGLGTGLGIVFRCRGSTGGTALIAQLMNYLWGWKSGYSMIGADLAIIVAAGFIFGAEVALFALLSLFVSGQVIDFVQEGFFFSKAAFIISEKEAENIAAKIMEDLGRGATFLEGRGAFSGEGKGIILCVVAQSQLTRLKSLVREIDPQAFIIVSNAGEVLGEGFKPHDAVK